MKTVMDNQCVQFVSCHNILRMTASRLMLVSRPVSRIMVSVSNTLVSLTSRMSTSIYYTLSSDNSRKLARKNTLQTEARATKRIPSHYGAPSRIEINLTA